MDTVNDVDFKYIDTLNIFITLVGLDISILGIILGNEIRAKKLFKVKMLAYLFPLKKNKSPLIAVGFNFLIVIAYFIAEIYYQGIDKLITIITIIKKNSSVLLILAIYEVICFLILNIIIKDEAADILNEQQIDELIREKTMSADHDRPLKIFGGDLGFFGKISDNSVENNKQLRQILDNNFSNVQIICKKPDETDKEDILRLGYLEDKLCNKVKIKFFGDNKCSNCKKEKCNVILKYCDKCKEKSKCRRVEKDSCDLYRENVINLCYNPDIHIRGRLMYDGNGAPFGVVSVRQSKGEYKLICMDSSSREFNLYTEIWDIWWARCQDEHDFLEECKSQYNDSKNDKNNTMST